MSTNEELLVKANEVTSGGLSNANGPATALTRDAFGGKLKPTQANRFLDYVYNQAVLVKDARFVRMNAPQAEIDKIDLGTRKMRKATEITNDGVNALPTFSKISLTTVKLRLDWEISTEALEDNIEGQSLEDHVVSLMARQVANDLEDCFIHGDTTSGVSLLSALDGWRKVARARGRVVDAAGANLNRSIFDRGLRNMPNKYLQNRNQLRWYTSSGLLQDYLWSLTFNPNEVVGVTGFGAANAGSPAPSASLRGENILHDGWGGSGGGGNALNAASPFGIGLLEVPLMEETETGTYTGAAGNHGVVELTFPQNRIVGVQRDIQVYRQFQPKKDSIEFTLFTRVAAQIENEDSYVHIKNVKVRAA